MNLEKKKTLAAKTLGVGEGRILLVPGKLKDIKEAITKQDIRDLYQSGAILIKPIHGRKAVRKRITRRRKGSIRQTPKGGKIHYIHLTRKLRAYLAELYRKDLISKEKYLKLRKEIRARVFASKAHLKEVMSSREK